MNDNTTDYISPTDLTQEPSPFFSPHSAHFNAGVAHETKSITAALLLNHIILCLKYGAKENIHHFDDKRWLRQSLSQFRNFFPYLSIDQIRRGLNRLVWHRYLIKRNFSFNKLDRTTWYTCRGL